LADDKDSGDSKHCGYISGKQPILVGFLLGGVHDFDARDLPSDPDALRAFAALLQAEV
jgi:hypothetical protein